MVKKSCRASAGALFSVTALALGLFSFDAAAARPGSPDAAKAADVNLERNTAQSCPRRAELNGGGAIITNGLVTLGVVDSGNLIYDGVGLTYNPTQGEALAPGCWCEGWGAADATTGFFGYAGDVFGYQNIVLDSFTSTASTAVSVVRLTSEGDVMRVTHDYHPSVDPNLFECTVTIQNLSGAPIDLRYRRPMDWDVPPTEFDELVTIHVGGATNVLFSSDDGFATGDPLAGPSSILFTGEATDSGPADHGALFDLGFGTLAPEASISFHIYFGAAGNQDAALQAISNVGAEVYSLGKPDPAVTGPGGAPNTYIFAFNDVGGTPVTLFGNSFYDDTGRSQFCVNFKTGAFKWNILSGNGMGTSYTGLGTVLNGNQKVYSKPGSPDYLNFTYDIRKKRAYGYLITAASVYSALNDKLTTNDPPGCTAAPPPSRVEQ